MKAHELLSDESKWCREAYALDSQGRVTPPDSPTACRWCIEGAIFRCYSDSTDALRRIDGALEARGATRDVLVFNDDKHRTFEEVRSLLIEVDV